MLHYYLQMVKGMMKEEFAGGGLQNTQGDGDKVTIDEVSSDSQVQRRLEEIRGLFNKMEDDNFLGERKGDVISKWLGTDVNSLNDSGRVDRQVQDLLDMLNTQDASKEVIVSEASGLLLEFKNKLSTQLAGKLEDDGDYDEDAFTKAAGRAAKSMRGYVHSKEGALLSRLESKFNQNPNIANKATLPALRQHATPPTSKEGIYDQALSDFDTQKGQVGGYEDRLDALKEAYNNYRDAIKHANQIQENDERNEMLAQAKLEAATSEAKRELRIEAKAVGSLTLSGTEEADYDIARVALDGLKGETDVSKVGDVEAKTQEYRGARKALNAAIDAASMQAMVDAAAEKSRKQAELSSATKEAVRELRIEAKAVGSLTLSGTEEADYNTARSALDGLKGETDVSKVGDVEAKTQEYRGARKALNAAIDATQAKEQAEIKAAQIRAELELEFDQDTYQRLFNERKIAYELCKQLSIDMSLLTGLSNQDTWEKEVDLNAQNVQDEIKVVQGDLVVLTRVAFSHISDIQTSARAAKERLVEARLDLDGSQIAGKVPGVEYLPDTNTFKYGEYTLTPNPVTPAQLEQLKEKVDKKLVDENKNIISTIEKYLPHGLHGYEFAVEDGKVYLRQPATGKETSFTIPQKDVYGNISHDENKSVYDAVVAIKNPSDTDHTSKVTVALIQAFETRMKAWNAQAAYQEMLQNSQAVESTTEVPAGMSKEVFEAIQGTTALSLRELTEGTEAGKYRLYYRGRYATVPHGEENTENTTLFQNVGDEKYAKFGVKPEYSLEKSFTPSLYQWMRMIDERRFPESVKYAGKLQELSEKYDIPVDLVVRLVDKESAWNPKAENPNGSAYGLGQHIDATWGDISKAIAAKEKGRVLNRNNPNDQLEATFFYLHQMMEQKKCTPELALVYYHTGPGVDLSSSDPMSDAAIAANYTMITRIRPEYKGKKPSDLFSKITQREYGAIAFAYYMGVSYKEAQKVLGGGSLAEKAKKANDTLTDALKGGVDILGAVADRAKQVFASLGDLLENIGSFNKYQYEQVLDTLESGKTVTPEEKQLAEEYGGRNKIRLKNEKNRVEKLLANKEIEGTQTKVDLTAEKNGIVDMLDIIARMEYVLANNTARDSKKEPDALDSYNSFMEGSN